MAYIVRVSAAGWVRMLANALAVPESPACFASVPCLALLAVVPFLSNFVGDMWADLKLTVLEREPQVSGRGHRPDPPNMYLSPGRSVASPAVVLFPMPRRRPRIEICAAAVFTATPKLIRQVVGATLVQLELRLEVAVAEALQLVSSLE
mgnify:CR=1 FL=1